MNADPETRVPPAGALDWSPLPGGGAVARVRGAFDARCAAGLEARAADLAPGESVVLSLGGVDYLSSSGVEEIVQLASRFRVALAAPSEAVVRVLTLAEVWPVLAVGTSEAEARPHSSTIT